MLEKINEAMVALQMALEKRDRSAINDVCETFVAREAALGPRWSAIMKLLSRNGEWLLADRAAELLIAQTSNRRARYERASLNARAGWTDRACSLASELTESDATIEEIAYLRGTLSMSRGEFDNARQYFRAVLKVNPLSGPAMLALSALPVDPVDHKIIASRSGVAPNASPDDAASGFFALGNVLHARKKYSAASEAFGSANRIMRTIAPYNYQTDTENARRSTKGWSKERYNRLSIEAPATTIFITGLPRSGTTILEQMLSAHPDVDGGGEMSLLRLLAQDAGGTDGEHVERYLSRHGKSRLPRLYEHLTIQRGLKSERVIDKSLDISRYMGLVLNGLPGSRIVWMRRSVNDCAWSTYRTKLISGGEWSWDFQSIARHFALETELHAFWTELEPDRILTVDYESLIADPKAVTQRVCDHVGLDFREEMLRPERNLRPVSTASVTQVREGINTAGLQVSRPYRSAIDCFEKRYCSLRDNLGLGLDWHS